MAIIDRTPKQVTCGCGYKFQPISFKVISRILNCPECRQSYYYCRNLLGKYKVEPIGVFKNDKDFEKRLLNHAKGKIDQNEYKRKTGHDYPGQEK